MFPTLQGEDRKELGNLICLLHIYLKKNLEVIIIVFPVKLELEVLRQFSSQDTPKI